MKTRYPSVAGAFYPDDEKELREMIDDFLKKAKPPNVKNLRAIIVPHAGYIYSGPIAAYGYKLLEKQRFKKIIGIGPSHYAAFVGLAEDDSDAWQTPLGLVKTEKISTLIGAKIVSCFPQAHAPEHCLEVQLPFLQIQLGEFTLVPVVVGTLTDHAGNFDGNGLNLIVKHLKGILDDRTLLVVSTNLTLYGPEYGYVPFRGDVVRELGKLDMELLDLILDRDVSGLLAYTKRTGNNFPGVVPILIMLGVLPPEARGTVLAYDTTARMSPGATSSVSFASVAFFDPQAKPPEEKPVRTLVSPKPQEQPAPPTAEANDAPASP